MCWGTLPPPATTTPWPKLSEAPRWQYSDLQKPFWDLDSCQFLTTNPCTFLHESILRVKMFSTLTISTVGASFLMHLLLHRECILNGPQERLGNSKAFTIILLPVSAPPRLKMDETTWNNYQLVQAFVYHSYLVDFQKLLETNWMTKYRVSTKCLPGNSSSSGVHFTGWQQRLHYFTFLDSQASWVKTAIRFAQPSWLRRTTSAEDFAQSSKLDGWSTKPKQNLRTREQNRRSGSDLITLCASNLRLHLKTDKIHQNSAIATDH